MAVVRNTNRTFKSGGSDINAVLEDYKKFVATIKSHAEEKVEKTVETITNVTNRGYSSLPSEEASQLPGSPIYYTVQSTNTLITGAAIAKPIPQFIYLEFGTRQRDTQTLSIRSGFKSGIDTNAVAIPYKSNKVPFFNDKASGGTYIFLNTIDLEGDRFLKNFWK